MPLSASQAFLLLLLLGSILSLLYHSLLDKKPEPAAPHRTIRVLLWHWPFGRSYSLDGDKCLEMYNISGCVLTDNTSLFSTADAVVFHHHELSKGLASLPVHLHRPLSQHWVWMSLEPPDNSANLEGLNGLFNWTMSYRRDADIPIPYGETVPGGAAQPMHAAPNRSCLVSWVISKYRPQQSRARVYQDLKKHIGIEVYGRWNNKPLSRRKLLPTIAKCLFYLSFENSEVKDYISEKLWRNAFQAGVVPVVLGPSRATYEALAPPPLLHPRVRLQQRSGAGRAPAARGCRRWSLRRVPAVAPDPQGQNLHGLEGKAVSDLCQVYQAPGQTGLPRPGGLGQHVTSNSWV